MHAELAFPRSMDSRVRGKSFRLMGGSRFAQWAERRLAVLFPCQIGTKTCLLQFFSVDTFVNTNPLPISVLRMFFSKRIAHAPEFAGVHKKSCFPKVINVVDVLSFTQYSAIFVKKHVHYFS
jgi:hypothetical protein